MDDGRGKMDNGQDANNVKGIYWYGVTVQYGFDLG